MKDIAAEKVAAVTVDLAQNAVQQLKDKMKTPDGATLVDLAASNAVDYLMGTKTSEDAAADFAVEGICTLIDNHATELAEIPEKILNISNSSETALSLITNASDVMRGKKDVSDALADIVVQNKDFPLDSLVALDNKTVLLKVIADSQDAILSLLHDANLPDEVVTTVLSSGKTIFKYVNGEISTLQCLNDLGDKGASLAASTLSASIGQVLIPIPVVGCVVGGLIGSALTSEVYHHLTEGLQRRLYEEQQRERIIKECEMMAQAEREYRKELEAYLERYFRESRQYFSNALNRIDQAFASGDADGIIQGANLITKQLGGNVAYETVDEFSDFLFNGEVDVL